MTGTSHEEQYTFLIRSHSVLFRIRYVSDKICRVNQNTHHAYYEIMWKNIVERGRPKITIWCMRIACWIPKATHNQNI